MKRYFTFQETVQNQETGSLDIVNTVDGRPAIIDSPFSVNLGRASALWKRWLTFQERVQDHESSSLNFINNDTHVMADSSLSLNVGNWLDKVSKLDELSRFISTHVKDIEGNERQLQQLLGVLAPCFKYMDDYRKYKGKRQIVQTWSSGKNTLFLD